MRRQPDGQVAGSNSNSGAFDRVLLGCYAAGCLTCAYLTVLSFSADAGHFCELAGTDCVGVIRSDHGRILGLSIATLGLGFFIGQAILLITASKRSAALAVPYLLLGAGATGLFFSGHLIYVMRSALGQDCLACYGAHAANAAALTWLGARVLRMQSRKSLMDLRAAAREGQLRVLIALSVLTAATAVFSLNWLDARFQLAAERDRLKGNLNYYTYLYETAEAHQFKSQISRLPAVFVDGKLAAGWEVPGFLERFTLDCGC
jgi:uncharacterized membrane protein